MQKDNKIIFVSGCFRTQCYAKMQFPNYGVRRVSVLYYPGSEQKNTDQPVLMQKLICTFAVWTGKKSNNNDIFMAWLIWYQHLSHDIAVFQ